MELIRSHRATRDMGGASDTPRRAGPWHLEPSEAGRLTLCGVRLVRLGLAAERRTVSEWPAGERCCPQCVAEVEEKAGRLAKLTTGGGEERRPTVEDRSPAGVAGGKIRSMGVDASASPDAGVWSAGGEWTVGAEPDAEPDGAEGDAERVAAVARVASARVARDDAERALRAAVVDGVRAGRLSQVAAADAAQVDRHTVRDWLGVRRRTAGAPRVGAAGSSGAAGSAAG